MAKSTIVNGVQTVITNTTSQDLELPSRPVNTLVCYDRIIAVDLTANPTLITIGLKRGASEVLLMGGTPSAIGQAIVMHGKVFAPGDYRPFARFGGAGSGDKVALHVMGYVTDAPA